jgi:hypothetical protein
VITKRPPELIDVVRGKSWSIGQDTHAVWWQPRTDACNPGKIVLQREDKAEVRAGTLAFPEP